MLTRLRLSIPMLVLIGLGFAAAKVDASDVSSKTLRCENREFQYLLFAPAGNSPLPAILLLHGAGDHAENQIEPWKHLAKKEGIALIAMELPRDPNLEDVAMKVFHCVVEDAKQRTAIDPRRIYLFGNSAGGYLAYDGATLESEYFAAAAVHAMIIADDYTWIVKKARRKTPIAIYIGDGDQFFKIEQVRKTRDLLEKEGFPLHYVELKGHDHNYYAVSDKINADAWNFLKENKLPESNPAPKP